ncbi:MAG: cobaltochelatase subunit CobN [Cyanobacteria bacterium J06627_15]
MHRLKATPGGWLPDEAGVVFIDQSPAPLVVLTAADTDIQAIYRGLESPVSNRPDCAKTPPSADLEVRVTNLLNLQQQLTIDSYAEEILVRAKGIVVRLLGGRAYWSYGIEVVKQLAIENDIALAVLPGDAQPDVALMGHSTLPLAQVNRLWQYFVEGGPDNLTNGLLYFSDICLNTRHNPPKPAQIETVGIYKKIDLLKADLFPHEVAVLFYRAHFLAGNTEPIDALCKCLTQQGLGTVAVYVSSLKDPDVQRQLQTLLRPVRLIVNTTSFAIATSPRSSPSTTQPPPFWQQLNVPVLQVMLSGGTEARWQQSALGLSPRDLAMNVALPEVDGRIVTRAVSFKTFATNASRLETDIVTYASVSDRVDFVTQLAANWRRLGNTPPAQRKIALVLANYPNRDGRLANGVGLDTPTSCVELLTALQTAGYYLTSFPTSGDALIRQLTAGVTNDPEGLGCRSVQQSLALSDYQSYFTLLPAAVQQGMVERWGEPQDGFAIAGYQCGNIFIGIQPSRGYDKDPSLNYHAPDLEPTHDYLAFYHWLRSEFGAHAVIHVGKHGNLEWLPGKSIALSESCYPEVALGPLPHFYPFIVNDPGEGSQAKRRAQAVIVDHLTPPLTRAELYGPLQRLESLVDEYYDAQTMDPTRVPVIGEKIAALLAESELGQEVGWAESKPANESSIDTVLPTLDGYLCELKESQIRDGLHVLGRCPEGRQLRDLVVAIARHPNAHHKGLSRVIAQDWQLSELDPLTDDLATPFNPTDYPHAPHLKNCRTVGDVVEAIEQRAAELVKEIIGCDPDSPDVGFREAQRQPTATVLDWITDILLPALRQTSNEITHLLHGLDGNYIPPGPAGAPTRNRPDVLPTGRNFYSVDIRAMPTESAWDVGRRAAEVFVETYTQDNGEYPKTLGLSMWGTAAMRTGGDDLAEALALLGVQPVWDGPSRRVIDFEILPLSLLGRPRVDVTLRVSGFFRDAFSNLIDLFDQAVMAIARLDEPADQNPIAARFQAEAADWQRQGLSLEQAERRASFRIFGSKPGAYGAGLQGLIEAQNWTSDEDLARAYVNWSSYAYGRGTEGTSAPAAFQQRLGQMQVVLHNQDNREHDLLDSDDYYQFQGGLTAAVKAASGQQPQTYFGDHSLVERPRVRTLKAEIARVYRSRVVNPKWIAGVMRHGYKGAFEMAATVDYLFAYDATTGTAADYMYRGVAEAYVLDPAVQQFAQQSNPWALRDMAERLMEANQRGLWQNADEQILDALQSVLLEAERAIEEGHQPS